MCAHYNDITLANAQQLSLMFLFMSLSGDFLSIS